MCFRILFNEFKELHPENIPVKEIYYPDGTVAIEVFKIYPDKIYEIK
jgi:hypothetical protein